jgi:hypothetical protein
MLSTIFSFLFFGREQEVYTTVLLIGIFISGISFIWILFKDPKRQKCLWFGIVIIGILIQQLSEEILIHFSHKIFLNQNVKLLSEVNKIMHSKPGEIFYFKDSTNDSSRFSTDENYKIRQLLNTTNIHLIFKDSVKVFYETYGMLDVRIGISYFYSDKAPDKRFQQIRDKWYY